MDTLKQKNNEGNTIRLVTWNIRWGRGIDNNVDLDRIVADLEQFSSFDILCLQEVAAGYTDPDLKNADGSNQFETLSKKLNSFVPVEGYAVDQLAPSGKRQQFGNMIFSRFPVLQVYRHFLPRPATDAPRSMPRMALEVLLETPLGVMRVVTTHLEFFCAQQRMAQVKYLRKIYQDSCSHDVMENKNPAGGPFLSIPDVIGTVLAGDFNFDENSAELKLLLSLFDIDIPPIMDAWKIAHPAKTHEPTMGYFDRDRWPEGPFVSDYVFVCKNLAALVSEMRVETQSQSSDHQALLLSLSW